MDISVVIPVHNGSATLNECLTALAQSQRRPAECIVVDDGSSDDSGSIAVRYGATVFSLPACFGPARARNLGARQAKGDLLVFLDADVAVHADSLGLIADKMERESDLDALIGAYDDSPADRGFVSQFKNLMHSFVHRDGNRKAFSFWCGCGAVRRKVFLDHGGLDESYKRPAIEDVEFGFRLLKSGHRLALDSKIQCKHLKAWTLASLIKTDVFQRGIPWTKLILRTGFLPDDLNLKWSQRISVSIAGMLPVLSAYFAWQAVNGRALSSLSAFLRLSVTIVALIPMLNRRFYHFLVRRRGWVFSISALPLHILYYWYCGFSFLMGLGAHALDRLISTRESATES